MSEQHKTRAAGHTERVAWRERGSLTRTGGPMQSVPQWVTWSWESIIVVSGLEERFISEIKNRSERNV